MSEMKRLIEAVKPLFEGNEARRALKFLKDIYDDQSEYLQSFGNIGDDEDEDIDYDDYDEAVSTEEILNMLGQYMHTLKKTSTLTIEQVLSIGEELYDVSGDTDFSEHVRHGLEEIFGYNNDDFHEDKEEVEAVEKPSSQFRESLAALEKSRPYKKLR